MSGLRQQDILTPIPVTIDGPNPLPVSGMVSATVVGEVEVKNDSGNPVPVSGPLTDTALRATPVQFQDDFDNFESSHRTLVASTDTTITFSQAVRMVKITNWDTSNRVLVKNGAIASDVDATAARIGKAPATDVPNVKTILITTASIHLRSAAGSEVTIEGYYGNA